MLSTYNKVSDETNFFGNTTPMELIKEYGSPLYVYNENIMRERCRELKNLITYPNFSVNFSVKANGNLSLLQIAREEGLNADAMSPGEIFVELKAGFKPEQILYISNNVSKEEMQFATDRNILVSVDSVSQLESYGQINEGGKVCIRFNSGVGAGHHEKVITGGKKTKFGVDPNFIPQVREILSKYKLNLVGINQHIGSLFMEGDKYVEGVKSVLAIAEKFDNLEFVDMGGGFGIPYQKLDGEKRLDLQDLGKKLDKVFFDFAAKYGKQLTFKVEPGRYIAAECGNLLGTVHSIKDNYGMKYVGTDLGFNVLKRPVMYDSHHDIEIFRESNVASTKSETVNIVGNICESGDIIAKQRELPEIFEGDIINVLDAGAYGYCMASNYNNRLRPAELLITSDGNVKLIRRRDTFEDLVRNFE
ncbi:diaminopimelate decarboxylase [Vallitalea sediminicola]